MAHVMGIKRFQIRFLSNARFQTKQVFNDLVPNQRPIACGPLATDTPDRFVSHGTILSLHCNVDC